MVMQSFIFNLIEPSKTGRMRVAVVELNETRARLKAYLAGYNLVPTKDETEIINKAKNIINGKI